MKLFRLLADPNATTRWHLRAPVNAVGNEVDSRLFTQGTAAAPNLQLTIPLRRRGDQVDFNFGDFDMVVTPAALNAELEKLSGLAIQRIPVVIESSDRKFEILNVVDQVRCIDEAHSQFTRWTAADGRSDRTGEYRMITRLRLDDQAASGHHLFRVAEWPVALIASEQVKALLENRETTGLMFEPVN